jgi:hypothetical protein
VLAGAVIDDDAIGASHGDADGVPEFGEWIELTVSLRNIGAVDAHAVGGTLDSASPFVLVSGGDAGFGEIPAGQTVSNPTPFVWRVLPDVPDGAELDFTLGVTEDPGARPLAFVARAPAYLVGLHEIDDAAGGDGDGVPEPGEALDLRLRIENRGGCDSPDLTGALTPASPLFASDGAPRAIGPVPVGGHAISAAFTIQVAPGAPPVATDYLRLALADAGDYAVDTWVPLATGSTFADALERDSRAWAHGPGPGAWRDEWHRDPLRNHTPDGTSSLKCGGPAHESYANLSWARLETGEFPLPAGPKLEFWHWIDTEVSASYPEYAYDGGLLEISTDGGASWEALTPAAGYPYRVRAGSVPGPFPAETPVWTGTTDWTPVVVDLSAYHGTARLRWSFGSDGAVVREGWYVDDVRVYSDAPQDLGPGGPGGLERVALRVIGAGVAGPGASLRLGFALPRATALRLEVFDVGGRRVRTLAAGRYAPGTYEASWDGRDAAGRPVASGAYYGRLSAEGVTETRRLAIVR